MSDMMHKLASLSAFSALSEKQLKEMVPYFQICHAKNREVVFKEGDPIDNIYIVLYGAVKIQKELPLSPAPVILNFLGRGDFLEVAVLDSILHQYPSSAVAMEDSALLYAPRSFMKDLLVKAPEVRHSVCRQVSERFLEFQNDRCMEAARMPQRLADLLIRLWEREQKATGSQVLMPVTRKDISLRLSTHTETIIRILSDWTKRGMIKTVDRHIEIVDIKSLRDIRHEKPSESIRRALPVSCIEEAAVVG